MAAIKNTTGISFKNPFKKSTSTPSTPSIPSEPSTKNLQNLSGQNSRDLATTEEMNSLRTKIDTLLRDTNKIIGFEDRINTLQQQVAIKNQTFDRGAYNLLNKELQSIEKQIEKREKRVSKIDDKLAELSKDKEDINKKFNQLGPLYKDDAAVYIEKEEEKLKGKKDREFNPAYLRQREQNKGFLNKSKEALSEAKNTVLGKKKH